jgi:hypothetical protein
MLDITRSYSYAESMDLHLSNPELEARIDRWVAETGRPADELVEDALTGYLSELMQVRETLDSRYDEIVSGKVEMVDGEEARARLKARTAAQRNRA